MMCEDSFLYYDTYVEFRLQKRCSFGGSGVQYGINPKGEVKRVILKIRDTVGKQDDEEVCETPCKQAR